MGNEYKSIKDMCDHYHITERLYRRRLEKGWSIEEVLFGKDKCVSDHLGNRFNSMSDMCKEYGVSISTFHRRYRKQRKSLKDSLEGEIDRYSIEDHLGNRFKSESDMCKEYGVKYCTYKERLKRGWSLKDSLTGKIKYKPESKECRDHLGNLFSSQKEMCNYYGVGQTVLAGRMKLGWSLEEALTSGKISGRAKECEDHTGKKFNSMTEMAEEYGIPDTLLSSRLKRGWSLEDSLTKKNKSSKTECCDHLGNKYESLGAMCEYYGTQRERLYSRLKSGWGLQKCLVYDCATDSDGIKKWKAMHIIYEVGGEEFWMCKKGENEEVMTLQEVFNLNKWGD